MARAWIITKDNVFRPSDVDFNTRYNVTSDVGTVGPRNAPDSMIEQLRQGGGHHFRMYDDDGHLYYEGRAIWTEDELDEGAYGPLGDYGMPNAGAVAIKYTGHPEFDC